MREFAPNDAFLQYAPAASSGHRDVAARHDEYLAPPPHRAEHAAEESPPRYAMGETNENRGSDG